MRYYANQLMNTNQLIANDANVCLQSVISNSYSQFADWHLFVD